MKRLYVFYDGECGLCGRCRLWLATQPVYLSLIFFPFQSKEALQICPYLPYLKPDQQLIVQSDEGGIYLGERAWLMCLYALREYRGWSHRLAAPALQPLAKRICMLVSHNRLKLSKVLFRMPSRTLEAVINEAEVSKTNDSREQR